MFILIPVKNLDYAKQRLSTHLSPEERKILVLAMLKDMLKELKHFGEDVTVVIVSKDYYVRKLSEKYEVKVLNLNNDVCMNSAISYAVKYLKGVENKPILIIPGDLPLIKFNDIKKMLVDFDSNKKVVTLIPSKDSFGTNGMLISPDSNMDFAYGHESLVKHKNIASVKNIPIKVFENSNISFDVDNVYDLDCARRNKSIGRSTREAIDKIMIQWETV